MERVTCFIKKEAVLCAALFLAALSACAVPPDKEYAGYIDVRTLAILFCLMCVMAGLQKIGVFGRIAGGLLGRVGSPRGLVLVLSMLCFFSSMLITNDVALITFVPFTFTVLDMTDGELRHRLALPLVAMQTIAANLGSMLTPIGNPQNLYLSGKAGISVGGFVLLMLPYTAASLVLLLIWGLYLGGSCAKSRKAGTENPVGRDAGSLRRQGMGCPEGQGKEDAGEGQGTGSLWPRAFFLPLAAYLALFLLCLLAVAHVLPWQAVFAAVLVTVLLVDRRILAKVDYPLLLTFVGFFVFIGNVGRIPAFRDFLREAVAGREVYAAVAASQCISNVPAALLLSGFTENLRELVIGVNLGGLGTLIASMASLISYKHVAREESARKGAYIGVFTAGNVCFLVLLVIFHILWVRIAA